MTPPPQPVSGFSLNDTIPMDPMVRTGELPNGLVYYIRENREPQDRAELRLVVNAGSILEDDDQQGLAHFNEHMAFNGTEHFEKHELVDYLELIGMQFGPELNAYTSFDETVYMLTIPTDSLDLVDMGFLVLRDWATGMTLSDEEIDKERGVIKEEWRLYRGAAARIRDQQYPILFKGSHYAERLPIGKMGVVDTCGYETLRRFYRDWYRPELMAVIAVGDIDADWIEERINKYFKPLQNPPQSRPRVEYEVPDHPDTLFAIASDPEATRTGISLRYKHDRRRTVTETDLRTRYIENLYNGMLNNRFMELVRQAPPPFIYARSSSGRLTRTKDSYTLNAGVSKDGIATGLRTLLHEAERVKRHGFTQSELDREKRSYIRRLEKRYAEREKTESRRYTWEYVAHFLSGITTPGIDWTLDFAINTLPGIELSEVNGKSSTFMQPGNLVVLVSAPEAEDVTIPEVSELRSIMATVLADDIDPYMDTVGEEALVTEEPTKGSIVARRYLPTADATEWTLSNGMTVVYKVTDFKDDEILFSAFSPGGHSLVSDDDYIPAVTATSIMTESGIGDFTKTELDKYLSDRIVKVRPSINELFEGLSGSASPRDLSVLFQLVHLYATNPRADSTAFEAYRSRQLTYVENREADPVTAWRDTLSTTYYRNHVRRRPWTRELIGELDFETSKRIYEDRFSDMGDFTFFFVGAIDTTILKDFTETYLASLPSSHREEIWKDIGITYPETTIEKSVIKGIEDKGRVGIVFSSDFSYAPRERHAVRSLLSALRIRLRETIREDLGGTYGIRLNPDLMHYPREKVSFTISFGCDPQRVDELTAAIFTQIDSIRTYGPTEKELSKVIEIQRRSHEKNLRENSYWLNILDQSYRHQESLETLLAVEDRINQLTVESLRETAKTYLMATPYVRVVLLPENGS